MRCYYLGIIFSVNLTFCSVYFCFLTALVITVNNMICMLMAFKLGGQLDRVRVHSDRMRCDFFAANNRMRFTHALTKINATHVIQ